MKKNQIDPRELESIPSIGKSLAQDLRSLGIFQRSDLIGKDPQALYDQLCRQTRTVQDPCVLYTFRCAVYVAETKSPKPELTKWWNWKNRASITST